MASGRPSFRPLCAFRRIPSMPEAKPAPERQKKKARKDFRAFSLVAAM